MDGPFCKEGIKKILWPKCLICYELLGKSKDFLKNCLTLVFEIIHNTPPRTDDARGNF